MYLSQLTLNPAPGCKQLRQDLASPYELHRTIMRAFPDRSNGGPDRVLFRLEPSRPDSPPVVLVQSENKPDWSALQQIPGYLLSAEIKTFDWQPQAGQRLRFRLRANPTVKREGKRHGLFREEDQRQWLERRGRQGGFRPLGVTTSRKVSQVSRKDDGRGEVHHPTHLAVDFEGVLEVTDPAAFCQAMAAGVGPAKGFGFGLLSVGPD